MSQQVEELQKAVAYLILNDVVKGAYWPEEFTSWAQELMRGENRVGVEIVRDAIGIEYN